MHHARHYAGFTKNPKTQQKKHKKHALSTHQKAVLMLQISKELFKAISALQPTTKTQIIGQVQDRQKRQKNFVSYGPKPVGCNCKPLIDSVTFYRQVYHSYLYYFRQTAMN